MKLILAIVFLLAASPPAPRLVPINDGVVVIVWENTAANSVVVDDIDNQDCRIVAVYEGLSLGTTITQAPQGPPYETRCGIRPGDRLYLLQYRDRQLVGKDGPFIVPMRVWLPVVQR